MTYARIDDRANGSAGGSGLGVQKPNYDLAVHECS